MKRQELAIPGVALLAAERIDDERGYFTEIFREADAGARFVQANRSRSRAGVLRGLHYHARQTDLWHVAGGMCEVALADLRRSGERATLTLSLSGDDPTALLIPPGVAHGFLALTDADLIYWVTHEYDGSDEHSVAWDDPWLAVPWSVADPILSPRDAAAAPLDWAQVERNLER